MSETTVYGLRATGSNLICDGRFKSFSKNLFRTIIDAEKHIPEFTEMCCDERDFHLCANRKGLEIKVVEYVLNE